MNLNFISIFPRLHLVLCLSTPPKPHAFVTLPMHSGIGEDSDNDSSRDEDDGGEDDWSSDEEAKNTLNVYRENEEKITSKYQTLIYKIKEEQSSKRKIDYILDLATSEENKIVKEEERLEVTYPSRRIMYHKISDNICSVWEKAYENAKKLSSSKVNNKQVEEEIGELYEYRKGLEKEIELTRLVQEAAFLEKVEKKNLLIRQQEPALLEKLGRENLIKQQEAALLEEKGEEKETEMTKSEGKRPIREKDDIEELDDVLKGFGLSDYLGKQITEKEIKKKRLLEDENTDEKSKKKKKDDDSDSDSDSGSMTPTGPSELEPSASSDTESQSGPSGTSGTGPSNAFKNFFDSLLTFIEILAEHFSKLL